MTEWRQVFGYEGIYSVSSDGQVRTDVGANRLKVGGILRTRIRGGYPALQLYDVDKKKRSHSVHLLVLRAFVGPCPDGHNANHKNGVKTDARLENLEYTTFSSNSMHAVEHGLLRVRGEDNPASKLTTEQVGWIRRIYRHGTVIQRELATAFGVKQATVSNIITGKIWRYEEAEAV